MKCTAPAREKKSPSEDAVPFVKVRIGDFGISRVLEGTVDVAATASGLHCRAARARVCQSHPESPLSLLRSSEHRTTCLPRLGGGMYYQDDPFSMQLLVEESSWQDLPKPSGPDACSRIWPKLQLLRRPGICCKETKWENCRAFLQRL